MSFIMARDAIRGRCAAASRKIFRKCAGAHKEYLRRVLDIGVRTVAAGGGLGMPLAVRCLVLDRLGPSGNPLLGGDAPGGGKRCGVARKRLGKHPVGGIGPAAVMLN